MPPDNGLQKEILQLEQRYAENSQGLVFAHLADAYRRAGEYSKAEGLLVHGLKTHPSYTSAYNVLGRVFLDSERFADAQEQFGKVLELDPQNLIALRALGDLAARRGLVEDARVWYERMLQVDPRSEEASEGLRRLDAAAGEPDAPEAEESAAVAVEAEPVAAAEEPEPDIVPPGEGIGPSEPAPPEAEAVVPEADIAMPEPEEIQLAAEEILAPTAEEEPAVEAMAEEVAHAAEEEPAFEATAEELPPTAADEPAFETAEEEPILDLVGQDEPDTQPIEGFIAEDGVRGFSLDVLSAEPETPESVSESEPSSDEPPAWDFDVAMPDFMQPPEFEAASPEGEPEPDLSPESAEEAPAETEAEAAAEDDGELWGHPFPAEGPDLPSMDDWSPGFVVGELLEGQASEDLKPEDLLEGLDAEFTIDIPGEDDAADEAVGEAGEAGAGGGMVTETMAELYATQGLYSDSLAVYQQLGEASPDDESIKARISELTRIVEAESKPESEEEELARLLKLTDPTAEAEETTEAVQTEPPSAPVPEPELEPEPVVEAFAFEDEAPVAGFEQLDPFAASFEVLAMKGEGVEPPAVEEAPEPAADLVEPLEEVEVELDETEMEAELGLEEMPEPEPQAELVADVEWVFEPAAVDELEAIIEGEPVPIEVIEAEPVAVDPVAPEPAPEEVAVDVVAEEVTVDVVAEEVTVDVVAEEVTVDVVGEEVAVDVVGEEVAADVVAEEVADEVLDEAIADVIVAAEATEEVEAQAAMAEIKAVDSIWELTGMEATEVADEEVALQPLGDDGIADVGAHIPIAEAGTGEEVESPTMEGYLADLLTFDAESLSKNQNPAVPVEASQPQAAPEPSGTEDLEQFQEWLRSLKR
jgi:tetratricopeptide (TPR) repeat protein